MKLFFKLFLLLCYAVAGFFSFYLVVIHFLENLDSVSKAMLFFQLGCSVVLASSGAIMFYRMKLSAIIAVACLLGLLPLLLNITSVPVLEITEQQTPDYARILGYHYPKAFILSFVFSVISFFLPPDKVRELS